MRQPQTDIIPSVTDLSQALATPNDWRAIVIVMFAVLVSQWGFIIWRELNLVRLTKVIDKLSAAMWAWRLALAEDRAERLEAKQERGFAQAERDRSREERRHRDTP